MAMIGVYRCVVLSMRTPPPSSVELCPKPHILHVEAVAEEREAPKPATVGVRQTRTTWHREKNIQPLTTRKTQGPSYRKNTGSGPSLRSPPVVTSSMIRPALPSADNPISVLSLKSWAILSRPPRARRGRTTFFPPATPADSLKDFATHPHGTKNFPPSLRTAPTFSDCWIGDSIFF